MKSILILFATTLFISTLSFSQDLENLKRAESIVWFGLDYSKVKFIGIPSEFKNLDRITGEYFSEWNVMTVREKNKFDFSWAYRKHRVDRYISLAVENSKNVNIEDIVTLEPYQISTAEAKEIVKGYHLDTEIQYGVVYIIESLDKINLKLTAIVAIFDIKTKEVLILKRVKGSPSGAGFKNYWLNGVYNVMKSSKYSYKKWLKGKD